MDVWGVTEGNGMDATEVGRTTDVSIEILVRDPNKSESVREESSLLCLKRAGDG